MDATTNTPVAADNLARTLAGFVHSLRLERVTPEVSLRARHLILDAIGCALAARKEDFALHFASAVQALSDGEHSGSAGVVGFSRRLPLRDAMLLNGILSHGLDYDDTHIAGVVHLSVSVLPAVLSLAGQRGARGADMLAAYIAGIEVGARIASVVKGGLHAQGFHPTGVVGAFASSLAAGRLLGLSVEQLVGAQGITLSLASGNLQFLEDGAWTKRIHPGWAAQAGLHAATFAAHDIPAPAAPYTGRYGLYHAFLDEQQRARIDPSLGTAGLSDDGTVTTWELENVAVKPFPMCHFVHASADAAIASARSRCWCRPARCPSFASRKPTSAGR